MDHVAIMTRKLPFLQRILNGQKIIESRWYLSKRVPWNRVQIGDTIYFKNVGDPVTVQAVITQIEQFFDLNPLSITHLVRTKAHALGLFGHEINAFIEQNKYKKYAVFMHLENVNLIKPFQVNKKGFGAMSAWISVPDIKQIVLN